MWDLVSLVEEGPLKQGLLFGFLAAAVFYAGVMLVALPEEREWTTSSKAALEELDAALEAQTKRYWNEARRHLEQALELDSDFVMVKLQLLEHLGSEDSPRRKGLVEELRAADLEALTARERFLVERLMLSESDRSGELDAHLERYLASYPDDPWVLFVKATSLRDRGDVEEAAETYQRLIEASPNWVDAYNQLGYLRMRQARFDEAEQYFTAYRFIAPDQANPHDSLGELLLIVGRFDEAVQSFEEAIQTRPDFWDSYEHLALAHALLGNRDGVRTTIERAAEEIPELAEHMRCSTRAYELVRDRRWQELLEEAGGEGGCGGDLSSVAIVLTHLAACNVGEWDLALKLEQRLLSRAESAGLAVDRGQAAALAETAAGIRFGFRGNLTAAAQRFAAADSRLPYVNSRFAVHKLLNRLLLVEALLADGRDSKAHALISEVQAVNPYLVGEFRKKNLILVGFVKRPDKLGWR